MTYDPYRHADSLGIWVHYGSVPDSDDGYYDDERQLIVLRHNLGRRLERCVLAHEVAHAVRRDISSPLCLIRKRQELAADELAASWLVDDKELRCSVAVSNDPGRWCLDLDITPRILNAYARFVNRHRQSPVAAE